jgi:hypothetical protein
MRRADYGLVKESGCYQVLLDYAFKGNAFFDEHDRNVFADRIQYLPVTPDQPSVEGFSDRLIRPIFQSPMAYGLVQLGNQRRIGQTHVLFCVGATENGEKILVDIDRTPCFSTFRHNAPRVNPTDNTRVE